MQELARACNSSKNNSCAITNLEKPVFSRLMNHKQKGRVLGPDDSYKGPYCEGIPLPQLLYKVSNCKYIAPARPVIPHSGTCIPSVTC